ncbi:hypothetical protein FGG90_05830 [Clavibacter tessellarius]|uniref:Uncharacterized protein n=1 Tax=Clavibacter tessellarius TaxID=31965 RepID=A0A225CNZ1_9MICO|nr:hypothetical protein [Clavibacter michiganensis]OQJ63462.1 hypothetical protein B5P24_10885 [Clavibacter michiganensis subsp. tessellarius]UKF33564.1 hypothetical protein FGG90_05830 [Clavibacter michiganensis subsp. tessellarius]
MTPTAPAPDRPQPLFRRVRRAWADAPAVVRVLLVAALAFAWFTVLDTGRSETGPGSLLLRAVIALAVGGIAVGSRWISRLDRPGAPREVEVSEAAEDGELPPGADHVAWIAALERRRREIRQEAWAVPIALALIVAMAFLPRPDPFRSSDGAFLVLLAVFVTWGMSNVVSRLRRRDGVDALLIPLQEQASRDAAQRADWAPPSPDDRIPPAAG